MRFFLLLSCLLLSLSLTSFPSLLSQTCTYQGKDYTSLAFFEFAETTGEPNTKYNYYVQPCGALNSNTPSMPAMCNGWSACQQPQGAANAYEEAPWNQGAGITYALINNDQSNGIFMVLPTAGTRQMALAIWCPDAAGAPDTPTVTVSGQAPQHILTYTDAAACDGSLPSKGGNSSGISGGWVFCIIVFVCVPVYFAAGCGWNYYKGARGVSEMTPQYAFWAAIPGLCKDGAVFAYQKIRGLCGGKAATPTGQYETL